MRADKRRLALIERSLATPWTKFRRPDGAAVLVPEMQVVDAFLRTLGGRPLGLGDAVEAFLAEVEPDQGMPDAEYLVVRVARGNAGQDDPAPPASNGPHGRPYSPMGDPDSDDPEQSGGVEDLLAEEDRLIGQVRRSEWLAEHYPEPAPRGLDHDLGGN
jgi:hypothetical protein